MCKSGLRTVSETAVVAGGVNWGVLAATDGKVNLVEKATGGNDTAQKVVYSAVGVGAAYIIAEELAKGWTMLYGRGKK